jgi:hypothetical protein
VWGSINLGSVALRVFGVIVSVVWSMVYAVTRAVFGLVVLGGRGEAAKDVELLVLRHGGDGAAAPAQSTAVGA